MVFVKFIWFMRFGLATVHKTQLPVMEFAMIKAIFAQYAYRRFWSKVASFQVEIFNSSKGNFHSTARRSFTSAILKWFSRYHSFRLFEFKFYSIIDNLHHRSYPKFHRFFVLSYFSNNIDWSSLFWDFCKFNSTHSTTNRLVCICFGNPYDLHIRSRHYWRH